MSSYKIINAAKCVHPSLAKTQKRRKGNSGVARTEPKGRAKLLTRVRSTVGVWERAARGYVERMRRQGLFLNADQIVKSQPKFSKGQWSRWHKVNTKRQRQLSALKRGGYRISPNETSLVRKDVR